MGLWLTGLFGRESLELQDQALGPQAVMWALLGSGAGVAGEGKTRLTLMAVSRNHVLGGWGEAFSQLCSPSCGHSS